MLRLWRRLRARVKYRHFDRELTQEIETHRAMLQDDLRTRGVPDHEARSSAARSLGNVMSARELARGVWVAPLLESVWQDIRYAIRSLRRAPAFTAAAVITLALGIGANTTIFSLLNAVILGTLPVRAPEELSLVYQEMPAAAGDVIGGLERSDIFAHTALVRFESVLPARTSLAAMSSITRFNVRIGSDARITVLPGQLVSGGYFTTLGILPAAGRLLTADDNRTVDGHPVAVVSSGFAQRQFGSTSAAVGRTLPINGVLVTIVGVARPGFTGVSMGNGVSVWLPAAMQHAVGYRQNVATHNAESDDPWLPQSGVEWLNLVIRADPEVVDSARDALGVAYREEVALELQRRGADDEESRRLLGSRVRLESFAGGFSTVRTQFSDALVMLMTLVALLLLIACANIANLLLARASARRREVAIRLSLGSGRWRLVRQLVTESALLSLVGCLVALPLARWLSVALADMAAVRNALPQGFALDGRVLAFTAGLTVATGLLFGLVPALRATGLNVVDAMKGAGATGMPVGIRMMRPLVVAQVGLSVLLVAAAALFGRSLLNLWRFDPGFHRAELVSVRIAPPTDFVSTPDQWKTLEALLRERTRAVPGVVSAEFSTTGIAGGLRSIAEMQIEGYQPLPGEVVRLQENAVGLEYFATVGMALREGRRFTDRDTRGSLQVVIVNEAAARRYFGDRSPVGKRLGYGQLNNEIVGVVSDARVNSLREAPVPMAFYPLGQRDSFPGYFDIRATGDPARVGADVRQVLTAAEPRLIVTNVVVIEESLGRGMGRDRLVAYVAFGFGALALLLACVGIYGVMSYAVVRRTQEIGVRAALGAQRSDLVRLVVADGLGLVLAGVVVGGATASAASRLVETLLFGIEPSDPLTYVTVIATLAAAGFVACYLPARRAARVDPMTALRAE